MDANALQTFWDAWGPAIEWILIFALPAGSGYAVKALRAKKAVDQLVTLLDRSPTPNATLRALAQVEGLKAIEKTLSKKLKMGEAPLQVASQLGPLEVTCLRCGRHKVFGGVGEAARAGWRETPAGAVLCPEHA